MFVANSLLTKVSAGSICSPFVNLHWLETCLQVTCYYEDTPTILSAEAINRLCSDARGKEKREREVFTAVIINL